MTPKYCQSCIFWTMSIFRSLSHFSFPFPSHMLPLIHALSLSSHSCSVYICMCVCVNYNPPALGWQLLTHDMWTITNILGGLSNSPHSIHLLPPAWFLTCTDTFFHEPPLASMGPPGSPFRSVCLSAFHSYYCYHYLYLYFYLYLYCYFYLCFHIHNNFFLPLTHKKRKKRKKSVWLVLSHKKKNKKNRAQ